MSRSRIHQIPFIHITQGSDCNLHSNPPVSGDWINPPKSIFLILMSISEISSFPRYHFPISWISSPKHAASLPSPRPHCLLLPLRPTPNVSPPARTWPASGPLPSPSGARRTSPPYLVLAEGPHHAAARRLLAPPRPPSRGRHLRAGARTLR